MRSNAASPRARRRVSWLLVATIVAGLGARSIAPARAEGGKPDSKSDPKPDSKADPKADPKLAEGRKHFTRGVELHAEGDFRGALIEFQRAYDVAPSFRILYNVAKANLELNDYAAALVAFERYLAEGGVEVPDDKRTEVEAEIQKLRQRVAYVTVECNVTGAEVTVDELPAGKTPLAKPIVVGIGRHRVVVQLAGQGSAQTVVDLAGGDRRTVELRLDVKPAVVAPTVATGPSRTPFWIGVATTSTLAVATGVFGWLALDAHRSWQRAADAGPLTPADVDDRSSRVRALRITTDVLGAATIVAGGATVYLGLSGRERGSETGPKVGLGLGSVTIEGRF
jgi:hypothetical protein